MKIAIIAAFQGYRDEELLKPYKYFKKNKINVVVYSTQKGTALGKLGSTIEINHTIDEIDITVTDALVFVGGPGGYGFLGNQYVHGLIRKMNDANKLIAAICMAPLILAEAGVLDQKNATVFVGDKEKLISMGACYTGNMVEKYDNIITANGPLAAESFAQSIVDFLK